MSSWDDVHVRTLDLQRSRSPVASRGRTARCVPTSKKTRRCEALAPLPSFPQAVEGANSGLLTRHRLACRNNQCVLLLEDVGAEGVGDSHARGAAGDA